MRVNELSASSLRALGGSSHIKKKCFSVAEAGAFRPREGLGHLVLFRLALCEGAQDPRNLVLPISLHAVGSRNSGRSSVGRAPGFPAGSP